MPQFDDTLANSRLAELRRREEEQLIQTLAPQYGYDYINLNGITINPEALILIPEQRARSAEMVTFALGVRTVSVAIKNPKNQNVTTEIERLQNSGYTVKLYLCSSQSLEHAWKRYEDQKNTTAEKRGVLDISPDDIARIMGNIKTRKEVSDLILGVRATNSARRVTETIEIIFAGALAMRASDIHIEPEAGSVRVRYRLDGVLQDVIDLEHRIYQRMMSRLKLLSGMTLNQRQEAQDGRFTFDIGEREIEIRSSVIPGADGESIVMRLLDPSVASFKMENLGLNDQMAHIMAEQLKRPNGLIITTGPTGSGKTTALYAFLQQVHTPEVKIITIEDPVEYRLDDIVQTQVSDEYTFASGLRAVLRQDPDVIMVGEIRDHEVAETAIHAAQTGHLVFSTLHTNNAIGAFARLVDIGVDPRMIGSAINIVLGQRLVRLLCQKCKIPYLATPEEVTIITTVLKDHPSPPSLQEPITLYQPNGCVVCGNTGYKSRVGIYEAVVVDEAVEAAIIRDPREHIIAEAARPQSIPTMAQDGIMKVLNGETSLVELRRVVELHNGVATPNKTSEELDASFSTHIIE